MTPEMVELARRNASKRLEAGAHDNVEFHLATIDRLPLADASADVVVSNCVINLAPDKRAVFREIARVLKPGGRLAVSDIALKLPLPLELSQDLLAYVGCIAGAIPIEDYRRGLIEAGFAEVAVVDSGADLNAYAQVEGQSGCCSPSMKEEAPKSLPVATSCCAPAAETAGAARQASASCCGPVAPAGEGELHGDLRDVLARYDVNDYAASVKVFAVKPR
jgi:SAM-dependent methyltransferase